MPSGTTSYTYDAYGRLETMTATSTGSGQAPDGVSVIRYTYDTHGNKESVIYPNGIITEYGYDNLNQLISVETRTLMSDVIASYAYTLNSKGQRTKVEERVGTQLVRTIDYTYDAADRLIEEQIDDVITGVRTISYTYDPVGNRLRKDDNGVITSYTYDDNDRLLTEACPEQGRRGGFSYGYDNNGNLLSKTGNGEQHTFTYNALNQLVHADIDTGGSSWSVDYVYDHDGIRVGKTLNGTDVTKYIVDKNRPYTQVLEEQWSNGALSATTGYVYGDALISRTTNGTTNYYLYDGMGSTRTLTDMSGTVTDAYQYDAYGNLLDNTGSTINPYRYRGEQYDEDLSSYYLRARYYQPGIGRFLTTDPVEGFSTTPISLHRYVYGSCDPISYIDPSGKWGLADTLGAVTILNIVSTIAISDIWGPNNPIQKAYAYLGEHFFPDAHILGVTGYISHDLLSFINIHFTFPPSNATWFYSKALGYVVGGIEVVMNISSGQVSLFTTAGFGGEFSPGGISYKPPIGYKPPTTDVGYQLYNGVVFNLWNANNYRGPFEAVSIGSGLEIDGLTMKGV